MGNLFVCNTSSDNIAIVSLENFKMENQISLSNDIRNRVGPHGICLYKSELLVANNYSNSICRIGVKENKMLDNFFIGFHCNDVTVLEDKAYIVCGESNSMIVFDLIKNQFEELIPCENGPHSISSNKEKKLIVVANMENDSITLMDCSSGIKVSNIRVGNYPTKALISVDGNYIYVCESNLGRDARGSISIISTKTLVVLFRILVGNSPVDMCSDEKFCLVSNSGDGTLSLINMNYHIEAKSLNVGGMPRGIIKHGKYIYVGDNYNNTLMQIEFLKGTKKVIPIGGEPTGIIIV